jgi:cytochrome oxidase Cu insertion factor (SCO1/SenC/PrrC family)
MMRFPGGAVTRGWLAGGLATVVLVAGVIAYLGVHHARQQAYDELARPTGIPAEVSTDLANLMQLTPLPNKAAPGFTLTDQTDHTMSLSSFRGKTIVLEFMDSHCTDICPIVSAEFVKAYQDLGAQAKNVVFLAVNVNPYHLTVKDVRTFSAEHGLGTIPDWHFLTGPVTTLQKTWGNYDIAVEAPNPNADVVHTSTVYFISPGGTEEFAAQPTKSTSQIDAWGTGIALVARHLIG